MAMVRRAISMGRTGGGLSYRWLSSGKSLNLVDTLAMVKGLEAKNVPSTQAEALTRAIAGCLESVVEKANADIDKSEEYQSTLVVEEIQKLRADIENMRAVQSNTKTFGDHDIHKIEQEYQSTRVVQEIKKLRADIDMMRVVESETKTFGDDNIRIHKLEKNSNDLKATTKSLNYALATVTSVGLVGALARIYFL